MRVAMVVLRLVHVLSGIFWVGSAVMLAAFITPAVRATGAAGGRVMSELMQHRKLGATLSITATLTIVSGLMMYWLLADGMRWAWLASSMGLTLGVGAAAALAGAVLGSGVAAPAARRLQALAARAADASGPPTPDHLAEVTAVQAQLARSSASAAALLVVAAAAMAVARYV